MSAASTTATRKKRIGRILLPAIDAATRALLRATGSARVLARDAPGAAAREIRGEVLAAEAIEVPRSRLEPVERARGDDVGLSGARRAVVANDADALALVQLALEAI